MQRIFSLLFSCVLSLTLYHCYAYSDNSKNFDNTLLDSNLKKAQVKDRIYLNITLYSIDSIVSKEPDSNLGIHKIYLMNPTNTNEQEKQSTWNGLEIVKLFASILTPLIILVLGLRIQKTIKQLEAKQWLNQKLIEGRIKIYNEIAPLLNDLLCFFTYVGNWKELSPQKVVELKRDLDKKIYLAAPLFSRPFFESCTYFMDLCYQTHTGWGQDAKIKSKFKRRKEAAAGNWQSEWDNFFADSDSQPADIQNAYYIIMNNFIKEISLSDKEPLSPRKNIPANIN